MALMTTKRRLPLRVAARFPLMTALLGMMVMFCWTPGLVSAYRYGDIVDTEIFQGGKRSEALRAHMPSFGVDSSILLPLEAADQAPYLSMTFSQGLLPTSSVARHNRQGHAMSKLLIDFVYSKSGTGDIHSVAAKAVYSEENFPLPNTLVLHYTWREQPAVQLQLGLFVMFVAALFVSVVFIFQLCAIVDEEDRHTSEQQQPLHQHSATGGGYSQKKW